MIAMGCAPRDRSSCPLQALIGDAHGLNTLAASAAEARRDGGHLGHAAPGSPPCCSRFPTPRRRRITFEIAIPKLASLYLTHDWNGVVKGLKDFPRRGPPAGRCPCSSAFASWSACGRSCSALTVWAWWLALAQAPLHDRRAFLRAATCAIPVGYVAVTRAGSRPKSAASRSSSTDSCAPPTRSRRSLTGGDVIALAARSTSSSMRVDLRRGRSTTSSASCARGFAASTSKRTSRSWPSARRGRCRRPTRSCEVAR